MVEDVTPLSKVTQKAQRKGSSSNKVLTSDFENSELAILAKRCARMATCVVNMCPQDPLFSWPIFTEEIKRLVLVDQGRGDALVTSLAEINKDPEAKDQLVRFVSKHSQYVSLR